MCQLPSLKRDCDGLCTHVALELRAAICSILVYINTVPVRMHMSMSAFGAGKGCGARSSAAAAGVRSTASARSARSACSVDGRARRDGAVIGRSSDCAVCAFCFSFPSAAAA